jgi:predicted aminopeptidase
MKKFIISIVLIPAFFCLSINCGYLCKQSSKFIYYNLNAKPVSSLVNKDNVSDSLKNFFKIVNQICKYAQDTIGLKKNNNFTKYVSLSKPYLLDIISACEKTSFKPYKWCYPFFGCWPLRGYYEEKDAIKEETRLKKLDYDVFRTKSDAFSTLGIFSDPLYSFMKNYSEFRLANLIIHEQTHSTIYIKNQVEFSEALACFIAQEGALGFIKHKYQDTSKQYLQAEDFIKDIKTYDKIIKELYERLLKLYESNTTKEQKIIKKKEIIYNFVDSINANYDSIFILKKYWMLDKNLINNAYLYLEKTYTYDLDLFYKLYEKQDKNLKTTLITIKNLTKNKGDIKELIKKIIEK